VRDRPRRGARIRGDRGEYWIAADVLQSGASTYTVTCVAPRELEGRPERAMAYLRRDREFVLATLFFSTCAFVFLGMVLGILVSLVLVAIIAGFALFAWATK
jgi:hypothetical protein